MIVVFDKNYSQLENESVLKYKKSMDPKGFEPLTSAV